MDQKLKTQAYPEPEGSLPKDPHLAKLWQAGIPAWQVDFGTPITSGYDTPETMLSLKSGHKQRKPDEIRLIPNGMAMFKHNGKFHLIGATYVKQTFHE